MKRYLGIDPGSEGALCLYMPRQVPEGMPPGVEPQEGYLVCYDMPVVKIVVSGKPRKTIDKGGLLQLLKSFTVDGQFPLTRIVIEKVSGRPGQGSGFEFGFGVGCLHMALTALEMPFDWLTPGQWKKAVKAPADKKAAVARADELLPAYRDQWRVENGRSTKKKPLPLVQRPDRAEAALLAYWAAQQS